MSMLCPKCQCSYQQRLTCPKCGGRLEYQAGGRSVVTGKGDRPAGWQETPWGRIGVGLLLAQGLYYGLWNLVNAVLLATDPEAANGLWSTMQGLLIIQGLQALGLLVGGALAGAGRHRGVMFGALVGVWNGLLFVIMQSSQREVLTPVALYGQPLLQTAFGALGGALGRFVWKPLQTVAAPGPAGRSKGRRSADDGEWLTRLFAGPVRWGRVLVGSAVVVGGTKSAGLILDFVETLGQGKLAVETHLQAHLITWEIAALAAVVGAAVAGAGTPNGMKQGLIVGILSSVALAGLSVGGGNFDVFALTLTVATAGGLSLGGGWFGGALFPPLVPAAPPPREKLPVTV